MPLMARSQVKWVGISIGRSPMTLRKQSRKWQIICAAVILPQRRGLSGRMLPRRVRISCRHAGSMSDFRIRIATSPGMVRILIPQSVPFHL